MQKTPRGWIQIGESRTRGVARIPLGLKPSRDSRATSQRDSPIWIQPLGVFRYTTNEHFISYIKQSQELPENKTMWYIFHIIIYMRYNIVYFVEMMHDNMNSA